MKKINLSKIAATTLVSAALFTGCGSSDSEIISAFNGKAVDGYISGAFVYHEGYKDEGRVTDNEGTFSLRKRDTKIILETNSSTTNMSTFANYISTMSAPSNYSVVTPLTTVIATDSEYSSIIADLINVDVSNLKSYLDQDPIALQENEDENLSKIGASLYGNGVFVEKAVTLIMADSNSSDLTKKEQAIKALFGYLSDNNTTLDKLDTSAFESIYGSFKTYENKAINSINQTRIGILGATISSNLSDVEFTKNNTKSFEQDLAENDFIGLVLDSTVSDENLTSKSAAVVSGIASGTSSIETNEQNETLQLQALSAQTIANEIEVGNEAPSVTIGVDFLDMNTSSNTEANVSLSFTDEDSSSVTYSATIADNDFLTFSDDSRVVLNQAASTSLMFKVNPSAMTEPVQGVIVVITPKDKENVVGDSKNLFVLVRNSNVESRSLRRVIATNDFESQLNIAANGSYTLDEDDKTITYTETNTLLFADTNNTDVATVSSDENNITIKPVFNGSANIIKISMDSSYNVTTQNKNITITGMDLPPIVSTTKSYVQTVVMPDATANVTLTYNIQDPKLDDSVDSGNAGVTVNSPDGITCNDNSNGTIQCTLNAGIEPGNYNVTATGTDGLLDGNSITYTINAIQGDVAPTLSVISNPSITVDAMTTTRIPYSASDLNGADTFDLNVSSSDETIATVSVDTNSNELVIVAQPKVGSTTISVYAEDNTSLKSETKQVVVNTVNQMDTLVSGLYAVPVMEDNGTIADTKYSISDFTASYDIATNSIDISLEVSGDNNYSISNFTLEADVEASMFGGVSEENGYAFLFSQSLPDINGAVLKDAKLLGMSTKGEDGNATTPYYWALATEEEICNAYGNNSTALNIINTSNYNSVNCN